MRAAVHRSHGGPDVIEIVDVADPTVGPEDVLVAVRAVALNRLDVLQREGPAPVIDSELSLDDLAVAQQKLLAGDPAALLDAGE